VTPPIVNRKMKPMANSMASELDRAAPHGCDPGDIFTPVGTAITMVAATK